MRRVRGPAAVVLGANCLGLNVSRFPVADPQAARAPAPSRSRAHPDRRLLPSLDACSRAANRRQRQTASPAPRRPPRWPPGSGPRRDRRPGSHSRQIQRVDSASRASFWRTTPVEHARGQALEVAALGGGEGAQRVLEHGGARGGDAPGGPAPGRGQRDARRARVGALAPADVAGRHEAVDEPHGARRGQAEDAPQAVDRAAVGELLERRQRRGRRQGLIGGRGDGIGHLVGDGERQRAEDVAVAGQRGHRATRSRSRARPRPWIPAGRRTSPCR